MAAKTALKSCSCSLFTLITWTDGDNGEQIPSDEVGTGCTASTHRDFAPGHDARLKGFLIRAGAADMEVSEYSRKGHLQGHWGAENVANRFGFGPMVAEGIQRAKDKAIAKAARRNVGKAPVATEAAPVAEVAPVVLAVPVTAKVGRWSYAGTELDGEFTYKNKLGQTKTTSAYTVLL